MRLKILLLTIICLISMKLFAQQTEPENLGLVKWLDLKKAQELYKQTPKPIIIDVYTDWCGWCKHMIKTTFSNPGIASYINANFYPVRFNAESADTIEFLDKKYINKNTGNRSPNELAIMMLEGKLSYPTTVFFSNDYKFKLLVPGYLKDKDIEPLLVFAVEYIFNTTSAQDFQKYFNRAYYPDSTVTVKDTVDWMKHFDDAVTKNKTEKKKTLVFVNTSWCNGGKVMLRSSFNHSDITGYLKKNFNLVLMDAMSGDTVHFDDKTFINKVPNQSFHPFLTEVMGGQVVLPSMVFFDEDMKFISKANQYLTPESMRPILKYFAENIYKTQPWDVYYKAYIGK